MSGVFSENNLGHARWEGNYILLYAENSPLARCIVDPDSQVALENAILHEMAYITLPNNARLRITIRSGDPQETPIPLPNDARLSIVIKSELKSEERESLTLSWNFDARQHFVTVNLLDFLKEFFPDSVRRYVINR